MPFERLPPPPPPPSAQPHRSRPPLPQDPSSSSSTTPSLTSDSTSEDTPTPDSEALASPLQQLSLHDRTCHSPHQKDKRTPDSSGRTMNLIRSPVEEMREWLSNQHGPHQEQSRSAQQQQQQGGRSGGKDADLNTSREASSLPFPPPSARPVLPRRTSSYSKRHASFDSPREVPLPYMPHRQPYAASTSQAQGSAVHDSDPSPRLSYLSSDAGRPVFEEHVASSSSDSTSSSSSSPPTSSGSDSKTNRGPVNDYMDVSGTSSPSMHFHSSRTMPPPRPQSPRISSSSSSPIPLFSRPYSSPDASRPSQSAIHAPRPMRPPGVPDRGSTASLPLPADTPYHVLPPYPGGPIQEDQEMRSAAPSRPSSSRPSLGGHQSATSSIPSSSSSQPRRSPTLVSDLEYDEFMSLVANRMFDRAYSSAARVDADNASSIMSDRPLPPPAPPTVLTPPPPPLSTDRGPTAPYEPFLAHAPAPQDSFIAVDTKPTEYRLIVKLPGFRRDAITVSTRKRRVLHVVADSWEPNGGHFEQRISFGYDALLAQVRAEFDGEHLQVIVPRRPVPMTYY